MQKNWHIVYTKPKREKKVAALLTKRKIENFYPVNCKHIESARKRKIVYQPLFNSYVFAYIPETYIEQLKHLANVVSLVHWKAEPAIINDDEIEAIKEFTNDHHNIQLVRTHVNLNDMVRIINGPIYSIDEKVVSIKNKSIKVILPSLGFIMVAEMENETTLGREVSFGGKELSLQ